jgi:hypothetical protein
MNKTKTQQMVAKLLSNAAGLMFGSVSLTVKIHAGHVVEVTYSTNEQTRDKHPEKITGE